MTTSGPASGVPSPSPVREDVEIESDGALLAAWFYPAHTTQPSAPCVVMGHGFSMTRADGLDEYAERFAAAGVHVLVFDHRYLGDSGGEPRQRFRIGHQQRDWRHAVAYARTRPEVDAASIVLWGYSFAGGHVAALLARAALKWQTDRAIGERCRGLWLLPMWDIVQFMIFAASFWSSRVVWRGFSFSVDGNGLLSPLHDD